MTPEKRRFLKHQVKNATPGGIILGAENAEEREYVDRLLREKRNLSEGWHTKYDGLKESLVFLDLLIRSTKPVRDELLGSLAPGVLSRARQSLRELEKGGSR